MSTQRRHGEWLSDESMRVIMASNISRIVDPPRTTTNAMNPHKASLIRGALIAYGVAFFWWYFSRALPTDASGREWAPGGVYMIGAGLVLQLLMIAAKWLAHRYEREHGMDGMLAPQVAVIAQLLTDAATVMLFAIATFRSIATVSNSI